ncbi:MAG: NAD-dependent epimerase/dehydratase family protein [Opitutales bacterium]
MSSPAHRYFVGKHLVVLGAGYIGGEVSRQARNQGMRVTALTRNAVAAAGLRQLGCEAILADLSGPEWAEQLAGGADFALNCVSSSGGGVEGYRQSYWAGMQAILAWARQAKVGTFVYTGSTSVYPQDDGARVDETAAVGSTDERTALLLATDEALRASTTFGRWFILRLAGIYGPGRHQLLDQLRAGRPVSGFGAHRLNLAHRDDCCAAIWAAFAAPDSVHNEVFNVADDAPAPKAEVAAWLAQRLGLPAPRFEVAEGGRGRRRPVPDRVILNAKIKHLLGWQPRYPDFRAGYESILATL